jgi:hypothetical protein
MSGVLENVVSPEVLEELNRRADGHPVVLWMIALRLKVNG